MTTSTSLFAKYYHLRKHKLWSNELLKDGDFLDSVRAGEEIIRWYVLHQNKIAKVEKERQIQLRLEK